MTQPQLTPEKMLVNSLHADSETSAETATPPNVWGGNGFEVVEVTDPEERPEERLPWLVMVNGVGSWPIAWFYAEADARKWAKTMNASWTASKPISDAEVTEMIDLLIASGTGLGSEDRTKYIARGVSVAIAERTADLLQRQATEIAKMQEVLKNIQWKSADRDNMEFTARITYSQMDEIRTINKREKHG